MNDVLNKLIRKELLVLEKDIIKDESLSLIEIVGLSMRSENVLKDKGFTFNHLESIYVFIERYNYNDINSVIDELLKEKDLTIAKLISYIIGNNILTTGTKNILKCIVGNMGDIYCEKLQFDITKNILEKNLTIVGMEKENIDTILDKILYDSYNVLCKNIAHMVMDSNNTLINPLRVLHNWYNNTLKNITYTSKDKPNNIEKSPLAVTHGKKVGLELNAIVGGDDLISIGELLRYEDIIINTAVSYDIDKSIDKLFSDKAISDGEVNDYTIFKVFDNMGLTYDHIKDFTELLRRMTQEDIFEVSEIGIMETIVFRVILLLDSYNTMDGVFKTDSSFIKYGRIIRFALFATYFRQKVIKYIQERAKWGEFLAETPDRLVAEYPSEDGGYFDVEYEYNDYVKKTLWDSLGVKLFNDIEESIEGSDVHYVDVMNNEILKTKRKVLSDMVL